MEISVLTVNDLRKIDVFGGIGYIEADVTRIGKNIDPGPHHGLPTEIMIKASSSLKTIFKFEETKWDGNELIGWVYKPAELGIESMMVIWNK